MATNQWAGHTFDFIRSVVVVVERAENTEQAWWRHITQHPEDIYADIKIFHFLCPQTSQNVLIA